MGLFASVSSKEVDEFAKNLALELSKRYPPALSKEGAQKLSQKRLSTLLEQTYKSAIDFKEQHKLGFYKKARLGNTFRWQLEDLGYNKEFIETATEGLVVYISRK